MRTDCSIVSKAKSRQEILVRRAMKLPACNFLVRS